MFDLLGSFFIIEFTLLIPILYYSKTIHAISNSELNARARSF